MAEQRLGLRFKMNDNVNCLFSKGYDNGLATTLDMSMKGAKLLLDQEYSKDEVLQLSFVLPNFSPNVETNGKVVWQEKSSISDYFLTGISFDEIPELQKGNLYKYLFSGHYNQLRDNCWSGV